MYGREVLDIANAEVLFKNFRGLEKTDRTGKVVNNYGCRTFAVIINDPDMANDMAADGWNIKILAPNEDHPEPRHYLPVEARFRNRDGSLKNRPPRITRYMDNTKEVLDEDNIGDLDSQRFLKCDLTINPNEYEPGKIKAFLNQMKVRVEPDDRWADWDTDDSAGVDEPDDMPF